MTRQERINSLANMLAVLMCEHGETLDYHAIADRAYTVAITVAKQHDCEELYNEILETCDTEKSMREITRKLCGKKYTTETIEEKVNQLVYKGSLKALELKTGVIPKITVKYKSSNQGSQK